MLLEQYIREIEALKGMIPKFAQTILIEHKDVITGLLQDQLSLGEDKFGFPLNFEEQFGDREIYGNGFYAESTEKYYAANDLPIRPKRAGSPYNFQWTGETFAMMDVSIDDGTYEVFSRTGKWNLLRSLYGWESFDLSEEHNDMINEQMLLPLIEDKLIEHLVQIM